MSRKNPPTIEIYPMVNLSDGSATLFNRMEHGDRDADFYDVEVRYDGDETLAEACNLKTFDEAWSAAESFQTIYIGADIEEINV